MYILQKLPSYLLKDWWKCKSGEMDRDTLGIAWLAWYGVESGMREKQVCINVSVVCGKIEEANVFWMGDNNVFL